MATVPAPVSWSVSKKITAALLNSDVRDEGTFWTTSRPLAQVTQTVAQTGWTSATGTAITFTTEDLDRDSGHSLVTNTSRIVIGGTLGWYRVCGNYVAPSNSATTLIRSWIGLNGSVVNGSAGSVTFSGTANINTCSTQAVFVRATAAADYVELFGFQTAASGTIGTAVSGQFASQLNIEWLGS